MILLAIGGVVLAALLTMVVVVVLREANQVTEVEAAPGYSVPEATDFVIERLPDASLRRMRRSEVQRLTGYCVGLLETAGMALSSSGRPEGDELEGAELVLSVEGLSRAMREGTAETTSEDDVHEVAQCFLEYLAAIGAVGDEAV